MNTEALQKAITRRLEKYDSHSDVSEITMRECASDNFSKGVEVTIVGDVVPVRPIIQAVEETDTWRIESMSAYADAKVEQVAEDEFKTHSGIVLYCPWIEPIEQGTVFLTIP